MAADLAARTVAHYADRDDFAQPLSRSGHARRYTFPKDEADFDFIEFAIRQSWHCLGKLKAVVVPDRMTPTLRRFASCKVARRFCLPDFDGVLDIRRYEPRPFGVHSLTAAVQLLSGGDAEDSPKKEDAHA